MIKSLQSAIEMHLAQALPGVRVAFYPDMESETLPLPMLALELSEFEPGRDMGADQLALVATIQARLVLDPSLAGAEFDAPQMAARVALEVYRAKNFGQPLTPARLRQVGPDGFKPGLEGYLVWLIEWAHEIDVGKPGDLTLPATLPPKSVGWVVEDGGAVEHVETTP
ncbi:hypothetical protein [Chromobacterium haemolyticum]|uniref:Uncharacterized protein n=1 Tax=Chromobacterium haemolyticum TaxID=394935 RepID=A0A1W0CDL2_9NEIS|nr:hypothetical protein [Chromobacterium haemolyticum]OQS32824.1 hypothetical protein B0T45_21215 [Chromobacterium haemolyticum]